MTIGNEFLDRLELGERLRDMDWLDEEPTSEHPAALPLPPTDEYVEHLKNSLFQSRAREAVALDCLAAIVGRFRLVVGFVTDDDRPILEAAERLLRERR